MTRAQAWQGLAEHHKQVAGLHMRELFARDPDRFGRLSLRLQPDPEMVHTMQQIVPPGTYPPPPMTLAPAGADGRFVTDAGMPILFVTEEGSQRPDYVYVGSIYRRES